VLWTLVRLQHKRYLKLQHYTPLRDALCRQYQQYVLNMAPQLATAKHSQQQQEREQQQPQLQQPSNTQPNPHPHQQQQQQQLQGSLHSWSMFIHGAVLLACARLRLQSRIALQPGTSAAICKVSTAALCMVERVHLHRQWQPCGQGLRMQQHAEQGPQPPPDSAPMCLAHVCCAGCCAPPCGHEAAAEAAPWRPDPAAAGCCAGKPHGPAAVRHVRAGAHP
jgi:hypothetical protein